VSAARSTKPVDPRAALDRAIERLARESYLSAVYEPGNVRWATAREQVAAGVWRQSQSDLHGAIGVDSPRWPLVKALHAVERAAHRYMESLMRQGREGVS